MSGSNGQTNSWSHSGVPATMYSNPVQQQQQQQQQQPNIFQNSANNINNGVGMTSAAGAGFSNMAAMQDANNPASGAYFNQQVGQYMNPYTTGVIDRSLADLNRTTQEQQVQNGANASMSGAFGGSRHGLVEAMTNSEAQRNAGNLSAGLLNQGFGQAVNQANTANSTAMGALGGLQGAGQQLGNFGSQQYGIGNDLNDRQFQMGQFAQSTQQSVMNGANNQFQQTANQPQNYLSTMMQALGMSPLNNATKTTGQYTPGLFDYLSLASQTGGKGGGS